MSIVKKPDLMWLTLSLVVIFIMVIAVYSNIIQSITVDGVAESIPYSEFQAYMLNSSSSISNSTTVEKTFVSDATTSTALILLTIVLAVITIFIRKLSIVTGISAIFAFLFGLFSSSTFSSMVSTSSVPANSIGIGTGVELSLLAGILMIWMFILSYVYYNDKLNGKEVKSNNENKMNESDKEEKPIGTNAESDENLDKKTEIENNISNQISKEVSEEINSKKETADDNKVTLKQ